MNKFISSTISSVSCAVSSILLCACLNSVASAAIYPLPPKGSDIIGQVQWTQSKPGDNFSILGRRYDLGYYELVEANPGVDPSLPHPGTLVVIPTRFILPPTERTGVVINLPELRLYYYPPHQNVVVTYPVGIGREGWSTPEGPTTVIAKVVNPVWVVPPDIKADRLKNGITLPDKVEPGPDDPLGGYALYLGFPGYRIHGTNDPSGIGRRSSSGCIRMWPEDIEALFDVVKTGSKVTVLNTAFKAGWDKNKLYLESHVPLQEQMTHQTVAEDLTPMMPAVLAATKKHSATIDWKTARTIAEVQNGIPQVIGVTGAMNLADAANAVESVDASNTNKLNTGTITTADASDSTSAFSGSIKTADSSSASGATSQMGSAHLARTSTTG